MKSANRVTGWVLGAAVAAATASVAWGDGAPAAKPAAAAAAAAAAGGAGAGATAAARAKASLEPLVQQGGDALAAGQYKAAREAFVDAIAIDPRNVRALHGAGICALLDKDMTKAKDAFERALGVATTPDRALVLNAAAFNLATRNNMRAAKLAKDYLAAHTTEPDEPVVNALGTALSRASAAERKNRFFQEFAAFYELANKRLEAQRPGYKRFGAEWLTAAEADAKMTAFARAQKTIEAAQDRVAVAEERVIQAQAEVTRQEHLAARGEGANNYYLLNARAVYDSAVATATAARAELDQISAANQRPTFPETIQTVSLDATKAPPMTPIVVASAATDTTGIGTVKPPKKPKTPKPAGTTGGTKPVVVGTDSGKVAGGGKPGTDTAAAAAMGGLTIAPPVQEPTSATAKPAKRRVTQYAAAFAVSGQHVVTAASVAGGEGASIQLQSADGQSLKASVVRVDEASGLALLKVEGRTMSPLAIGDAFAGGAVTCAAYPTVDLFNPAPQLLSGTATAPKAGGAGWAVSLSMHPRLAGSPVLSGRKVVGVCVAARDAEKTRLPAVTLEQLKAFVGGEAEA